MGCGPEGQVAGVWTPDSEGEGQGAWNTGSEGGGAGGLDPRVVAQCSSKTVLENRIDVAMPLLTLP